MLLKPGIGNVVISRNDLTGRTIIRKAIYLQVEATLSTGNLISGVYIVKLEPSKGTYARQILVSR